MEHTKEIVFRTTVAGDTNVEVVIQLGREEIDGFVEVQSIYTDNPEVCFWDNLSFFIGADFKTVYDECSQELIDKGLLHADIFETVIDLVKEAIAYYEKNKNI